MRYYGWANLGIVFKKYNEWWFSKAGSFCRVNMLSLGRVTLVWNFKRLITKG